MASVVVEVISVVSYSKASSHYHLLLKEIRRDRLPTSIYIIIVIIIEKNSKAFGFIVFRNEKLK